MLTPATGRLVPPTTNNVRYPLPHTHSCVVGSSLLFLSQGEALGKSQGDWSSKGVPT